MSVHRRVAALGVTAVLAAVAGCAAPQYQYVSSTANKTYFRVPSSWHEIDQQLLSAAINGDPDSATAKARQQVTWTVAYDSDRAADVSHIFGVQSTAQPVVWAKVETLPDSARDAVSLDSLRDMVLPVTDAAREQATEMNAPLAGFELLADDVVTPAPGVRGIHEIYNYRLGGTLHTFDQTALMNNDDSRIYLLFVRCTARCYADRSAEINGIVKSFTVRSS